MKPFSRYAVVSVIIYSIQALLSAADASSVWPAGIDVGAVTVLAAPKAGDWRMGRGVTIVPDGFDFRSEKSNLRLVLREARRVPMAVQARVLRVRENHKMLFAFPELGLGFVFNKQFQSLSVVSINPRTLDVMDELSKASYRSIGSEVTDMDDFILTIALGETKYAVWMDRHQVMSGDLPVIAYGLDSTFAISGGWHSNFAVTLLGFAELKKLHLADKP